MKTIYYEVEIQFDNPALKLDVYSGLTQKEADRIMGYAQLNNKVKRVTIYELSDIDS